MADIFISYAREDLAWVEKLNRALEAQGYSVWWDRNLATGARYLKETEAQCAAFLPHDLSSSSGRRSADRG